MLVQADGCDTSEQQFEDSLITSPVAEYRSIQLGSERNFGSMEAGENQPTGLSRVEEGSEDLRTDDCEESASGIARQAAEEQAGEQHFGDWRDEVASRLNNYARRRGRKRLAGEFSMQLDFERARRSNAATAAALDRIIDAAPQQQSGVQLATQAQAAAYDPQPDWNYSPMNADFAPPAQEHEPESTPAMPAITESSKPRRTHHHIIEFPRLFPLERTEDSSDELAEAVGRPRILDVPEETEQIFLPLVDISLEMQQQAEDDAAAAVPTRFELPIQVAPISQRLFAAIADTVLVLFGTAIFAGMALNIAKELPHNKIMLAVGLLVPCVLWSVYHYLFLVHAGATPGMKVAQLRLSTFSSEPTDRHIRRARALSLMLSLASAGMGFGWAAVDEDTLCWHDRISRTYLTNR